MLPFIACVTRSLLFVSDFFCFCFWKLCLWASDTYYLKNAFKCLALKFQYFCVQFVEYSKMIYLDGDIQVFENIDHHLFDLPDNHFYVVMDCFCEKT